jgi:hypothetical protein
MTENKPCALCGLTADYSSSFMGSRCTAYGCPKCGRYVLDEFVEESLANDQAKLAFRLACVIRERRLRGQEGSWGVSMTITGPPWMISLNIWLGGGS